MKATASLRDLASTGMPTDVGSQVPVSLIGRLITTVKESAAKAYGEASDAVTLVAKKTASVGIQAQTTTAGVLDSVKARCHKIVEVVGGRYTQGKQLAITQVDAARVSIGASLVKAKSRFSGVSSSAMQKALGYVPTGVKANVASSVNYVSAKVSDAYGIVNKLAERTLSKALAIETFAETKALALKDACRGKAVQLANNAQALVMNHTPAPVKSAAANVYCSFTTKALEVNTTVKTVAADPKAQATAVGATGGAVALGATGGTVGMVSGSAIGAAVGLVPAIFTFGLSIPIGAMIGGGAGLCVGTTVGCTTGFVAGGAAGYKKDAIKSGTKKALEQAGNCAQYAKDKADTSRHLVLKHATSSASYVRARVQTISGTGGTDTPSESE